MTTSETKEPVENETTSEEPQQNNISDRRLILGPLAMYGIIAFVIAGLIVTTAIVIGNEFNQIDNQVATLDDEIAQQNQMVELAEPDVTESNKNTEEPLIEATEVTNNNSEENVVANVPVPATEQPIAASPLPTLPLATSPLVPAETMATTTTPPQTAFDETFDPMDRMTKRMAARIVERNQFMAKQDQELLDAFKNSQAKQIEMMRKQLVRQQERIDAMEKRHQETYELREAAIKRMQEAREQSLNRI